MDDIITGRTNANGKTVIFLPYREKYRYDVVASLNEDTLYAGFGRQTHNIRRGTNDPVIIYVHDLNEVSVMVRKHWDIDSDLQDMPAEPPVYAVQELDPDTSWSSQKRITVLSRPPWSSGKGFPAAC